MNNPSRCEHEKRAGEKPLPSGLAPHYCHCWRRWPARANSLAVVVALQDFLPDGSLDAADGVWSLIENRRDDRLQTPGVEFLHECSLLFGHMFVPFGKR